MNRYTSFSIKFITFLLILVLFNIALSKFFSELYEHNPLIEIINEQHKQGGIYASLLNNHEFAYSTELVPFRKPEVIALGSSRVLPFREQFFSEKFVGAGRAVTQISEAELFLSEILEKETKPKIILFGLDFWWFHESMAKRSIFARHLPTEGEFASNKLRGLLTQLLEQRVDVNTVYEKLRYGLERVEHRENGGFYSMGLGALQSFSGLREDGSYFYGNILTGLKPSPDIGFRSTLRRIDKGTDKFSYGQNINEKAWQSFMAFMTKADKNNVKVILFYPPLSKKVYDAINYKTVEYKYIQLLTKRLESVAMFFNFHNPNKLLATDCEFIDGFHGGDVVYARMLEEINKKVSLPLNKNLKQYINIHKNKALIRLNELERSKMYQEVDFLEIGCKK